MAKTTNRKKKESKNVVENKTKYMVCFKNLESIKDTFKEIGGDTEKLGITLINEAIFCGETLSELKSRIKESGVITSMCQGAYSIDRENPALRSYNTTIKNYQNILTQICKLLPNAQANVDDGFDDF